MRSILVSSLLGLLSLSSTSSADAQTELCRSNLVGTYPADPEALAEIWLAPIERLYAAIPSLSPREEQWLNDESADPERYLRAARSSTYAVKEAKLDVGSLLGALRVLSGDLQPAGEMTGVESWAFFAQILIDYDAALYLARLETEGILDRTAIPKDWTILAGLDFPLEASIRSQRVALAEHVLACIVPQVSRE